jgi:hypothetical protein
MKNSSLLLITILFSLTIMCSFQFEGVKASNSVNGIIDSNASWSQTNGPWNLTGNVLIDSGVTVTVEPGSVVNLNGYYIRVNGSLNIQQDVTLNMGVTGTNVGNIQVNGLFRASGTNTNPIKFNGGTYMWDSLFVPPSVSYVTFSGSNMAWSEQTGSGCIIEYAFMNKTGVTTSSSIKFSNNQLSGAGISVAAASPVISSNVISSGISISGGSPIIANNNLNNGYIWIDGSSNMGSPVITSNVISNINPQWPYATSAGIAILADAYNTNGLILVEKNIIKGSSIGVNLIYRESQDIDKPISIRYNTILSNDECILIEGKFSPTITNNNFYSNNTCLKLSASRDITAAQNYWGTTDSSKINGLIYDSYDDFNLGKVTYSPILTSPDTSAPDPNSQISPAEISYPISTPTITQNPTFTSIPTATAILASPSQNSSSAPNPSGSQIGLFLGLDWIQIVFIVLLTTIAILLFANILLLRKTRAKK